jgi:2-oxoisovalerate dehydrogenase E1 component
MKDYIPFYKKCYSIRKVETHLLELFRQGKVSGTVHTCVGQEYTGVLVGKYYQDGDLAVSNHRGHGHYLSITDDLNGLIAELLGKDNGSSKGIGGSQHLINKGFISNGIQGGMTPIASGYSYANKLKEKLNVSFVFIGDGTLGEGVLYETLNMVSKWKVPVVFILENNQIAQSTSFKQSFSGDLKLRIEGFGVNYLEGSIYEMDDLDQKFFEAINKTRNDFTPSFINVELGRLNSHSKGDDNRNENLILQLKKLDPLNLFLSKNKEIKDSWDIEFDKIINNSVSIADNHPIHDIKSSQVFNLKKSYIDDGVYKKNDLTRNKNRFNDLIYNYFKEFFKENETSFLLGEDIETMNEFNPKEYGGAFKVTKDLSLLYKGRVRNTPISEQAIAGFGIGLALNGYTTFVEIMFGDFTTLIFDQIYQHASKINLMFGKIVPLPLIIRSPMGGYRGYGPTHSQSIEKHFLGIPGFKVLALNQLIDPAIVYKKAVNEKSPMLIVENKMLYTRKLYENLPNGYDLYLSETTDYPIANLRPIEDDPVFTIVAYGGIVNEVMLAMEDLFIEEECMCDLFFPTELSNVNIPDLKKSVQKTKKILIIEEGNSFASYSSEVSACLSENNVLDFQLFRISNNGIVPSSRDLELNVLPSSNKILELIKKQL